MQAQQPGSSRGQFSIGYYALETRNDAVDLLLGALANGSAVVGGKQNMLYAGVRCAAHR